jgi:hypothetical protein
MDDNKQNKKESRRDFLRLGLGVGITSVLSVGGANLLNPEKLKASTGEKVKVLTQDGKLVEVDKSELVPAKEGVIGVEESKKGLPNRKFVMVIDLARCKMPENVLLLARKDINYLKIMNG